MIPLSPRERKILAFVQLQADAPIQRIAREVGVQAHTVRSTLQNLVERGAIMPFTVVNPFPLGYSWYLLLFSLPAERKAVRQEVVQAFANIPEVSWLASFSGDFDYQVGFHAKSQLHAHAILNELSNASPYLFRHKSFALRTSFHYFTKKYLTRDSKAIQCLTLDASQPAVPVTELDLRILGVLDKSPLMSVQALAAQLGVPASTVDFRIKRLKKTGILAAICYGISFPNSGVAGYRLNIQLRDFNDKLHRELLEFARRHPNISSYSRCLGSWDAEFGIEADSYREVSDLEAEVARKFGKSIASMNCLQWLEELIMSQKFFLREAQSA